MKNRKSVIALLLVAIVGIVGLTLAYFTNTSTIENVFKTNKYGTSVDEQFVSPDNWTPGTTTPKTLTVTNTGNVDEAVRVSYTEKWELANHNELSGWITSNGEISAHANDEETDERAAIINWANSSEWTYSNGYYYYNYKLSPNETTPTLLDSVTFNEHVNVNSTCETDNSQPGKKIITCSTGGNGYGSATYKLTFNVETVQYDKYKEAWGINTNISAEKPVPGAQTIMDKSNLASITNYTDGDKHEMFVFNHPQTYQTTALTDYRYIGDDPYNYVYFNCSDLNNQNTNTCEIWRMLGVFDVQREIDDPENDGQKKIITEKRIKLVRGTSFATEMMWDNQGTYGENDWSNAILKTFLNDSYLNGTGDAETYGLKESARQMINDAVYYLGGYPNDLSNYGSTEEAYDWERGNKLCDACYTDTSKLSWIGKVGLMYPSDEYMTYGKGVDTICYDDPSQCDDLHDRVVGWVLKSDVLEGQTTPTYTWFLSPVSNYSFFAFMSDSGDFSYDSLNNSHGVRPVVYLKADVKIAGGTGTSNDPYKFSL